MLPGPAPRPGLAWLRSVEAGSGNTADATRIEVETMVREGDQVAMTVRFDRGMRCWRHSFVVEMLDDGQVEQALTAAGFDAFEWRGARRLWIAARAPDEGM